MPLSPVAVVPARELVQPADDLVDRGRQQAGQAEAAHSSRRSRACGSCDGRRGTPCRSSRRRGRRSRASARVLRFTSRGPRPDLAELLAPVVRGLQGLAKIVRTSLSSSTAIAAAVVPPVDVTCSRSVAGCSPVCASIRPAPSIVANASVSAVVCGRPSSTAASTSVSASRTRRPGPNPTAPSRRRAGPRPATRPGRQRRRPTRRGCGSPSSDAIRRRAR